MADLYFSREIDAKYENNINFFAQEPEYRQDLSFSFPSVSLLCLIFLNRS